MRHLRVRSMSGGGITNRLAPMAGLIVVMLVSLTTVSACGEGSTGGSEWEGPARLVPETAHEVSVVDVAAIVTGDSPIAVPGDLVNLTFIGFRVEDVSWYAAAQLDFDDDEPWRQLHVVEGDFDFEAIRSVFTDGVKEGYLSSYTYGDHDIYDTGGRAIALLEEEDSVVAGDVDAVEAVLDALAKGSGFLLHGEEPRTVQYATHFGVAADEYVGMTLNRAHGGFFAHANGSSPTRYRGGGWGSGWSASAGSGSTVKVRVFLSWETEDAAKSIEDEVKAWFETALDEGMRLESVERDGLYIVGTATVDEADWDDDWTRFFTNSKPY